MPMRYWFRVMLFLFISTLLYAQEEAPLWLLGEHNVTQRTSLQAIQTILDKGYIVTGIDYTTSHDTLKILYLLDLSNEKSRWTLYEFTEVETLETELSAALKEGFRPIDIAVGPNGLIVFFVEDGVVPQGWRIERSTDFSEIQRYATIYSRIDYSLQGLTKDSGGYYWALFVKYEETKTNSAFEFISKDMLGKRLVEHLEKYATLGQLINESENKYIVAFNTRIALQKSEE